MKNQASFFKVVAGGILCLILLSGTGAALIAPRPAWAVSVTDSGANGADAAGAAQDAAEWSQNTTDLQTLLKLLQTYHLEIKNWFAKVLSDKTQSTKVESAAMQGYLKTREKMTDKDVDDNTKDVLLTNAARASMKNVLPKGQRLCNNIMIGQLKMTTEAFERSLTRAIVSAIEQMYRGPGEDGAGPQYARDQHQLRCQAKLGNAIDYPDECVDKSTKGTDGRSIQDADLRIATITGGQVLEMPAFKSVTINGASFRVPDPQNAEQKFWTAGFYYCFNMAGPRPSPPYGKELDTPEGRVKYVRWENCAAKQSGLIEGCSKLLAHHTRPGPTMTTLVAEQKKRCEAAKKEQIQIPASFDDCNKGVSAYQAAYIEQAQCKNPQYYISQKSAGAKDPKLMNVIIDCAMSWSVWKETEASLLGGVLDGAAGLLDIQACWDGVGK